MPDNQAFIAVMADEGLQTPKYSAHVHQLIRLEQLVDVAMNNYANISSNAGRDRFMSSIELIYVALTPFLKKEDRKHIQSWLIRLRDMADDMNAMSAMTSGDDLISMRKFAWQILEILNMLKTKRGLGVPTKEKKILEEELAESADVIPEDLKYEVPEVPEAPKKEKGAKA